MNTKKKPIIMSSIDIGSYSLKMKIVEVDEVGNVRVLERVTKPAALGKDSFSEGKVRYETVEYICDILKGFQILMKEYNSKRYRAVATSAVREAENREYLIDQIQLKTGLKVEVVNNAQERYLTYKGIRENLPDHDRIREEGVLIVEVGSGSVEMTIYSEGRLRATHNFKLGHLRLLEVLSDLKKRTLKFPDLMEEYIEGHLDILTFIEEDYTLKHFIVLGSEMRGISKLLDRGKNFEKDSTISIEAFHRLYDELLSKSIPEIAEDYQITSDLASILLPSLIIIKKSASMILGDKVHLPLISLSDGIVSDFVDRRFHTRRQQEFSEDVQQQALSLGKKYHADLNHARDVEEKSILLFDALKRTHGMKNREKFLLRLACKLHDIGKFVNLNKHYLHSYELIKASPILSLSEEEMEIVANVSKYHSSVVPQKTDKSYGILRSKDQVTTSKLTAILRLADAMDRNHSQKISNVKIVIKDREMIVRGDATVDTLLEEWTFEIKGDFFREVFGMNPQLKIRRKVSDGT